VWNPRLSDKHSAGPDDAQSHLSIPPDLTVNRPFLFLIEDVETKTVLFLGRIVKP
jgi:serine protease inhibitor